MKGGVILSYDSYSSDYDVLLGGLFVTFAILALILGVLGYILTAIIYYNTAKTNGLAEIAFWSWIPLVNVYVLFALGSTKLTIEEIKKDALKFLLIYIALTIISFIPIIGFLSSIALLILSIYFIYRLFYRWTGESGKSILFVVLTVITAGIFYYIYGLIKMKKAFVA
jgi:hypothetical protein